MIYLKMSELIKLSNEELLEHLENNIFQYNESARASQYIEKVKNIILSRMK